MKVMKSCILLQSGPVNNRRGKKNLVLSAWGDDSLLSEDYVNPHYDSSSYQSYSEQTQKNLVNSLSTYGMVSSFSLMIGCVIDNFLTQKRLNEDVIDYDLLEYLVCHVDETCGEGAILIFLPVSYPKYFAVSLSCTSGFLLFLYLIDTYFMV